MVELAQNTSDLLRIQEVAMMLNLGESSVWRHVKNGDLPKPIKIGGTTRWRRETLESWIASQEAA